jgi:hypothetical protein
VLVLDMPFGKAEIENGDGWAEWLGLRHGGLDGIRLRCLRAQTSRLGECRQAV